jgi:hypothetical protein
LLENHLVFKMELIWVDFSMQTIPFCDIFGKEKGCWSSSAAIQVGVASLAEVAGGEWSWKGCHPGQNLDHHGMGHPSQSISENLHFDPFGWGWLSTSDDMMQLSCLWCNKLSDRLCKTRKDYVLEIHNPFAVTSAIIIVDLPSKNGPFSIAFWCFLYVYQRVSLHAKHALNPGDLRLGWCQRIIAKGGT